MPKLMGLAEEEDPTKKNKKEYPRMVKSTGVQ